MAVLGHVAGAAGLSSRATWTVHRAGIRAGPADGDGGFRAGRRIRAVFYVVPLLGGVAVWATYLMGTTVAGPMVGLAAAVLLATSPVFLYQLMSPMSDVPVTAWWALCLALLPLKRRDATLAAGLFAGIAILTRPNLVPILCVPGLFLLWAAVGDRSHRGPAVQRLLLFARRRHPRVYRGGLLQCEVVRRSVE